MLSFFAKHPFLPSFLAGLLNGIFGTGGGIPLWFTTAKRKNKKTAFATTAAGVLLLSLFSVLLYSRTADPLGGMSPLFLFFAVCGGAFGASLLDRLKSSLLTVIFAILLIGSGGYLIIDTLFF